MKDHLPRYERYRRGRTPITNRPVFGYRVICSCGEFEQRVNGQKREAESAWMSHRRSAVS